MTRKFSLIAICILVFSVLSFSVVFGAELGNNSAKMDSNIRLKPAYNAPRIGYFKKGHTVVVKQILGRWCKVEYRNYKNAYVYCPLLTQSELTKHYEHVFYQGHNYKIVFIRNKGIVYVDMEGNIIHQAYNFDNGPDYFTEGLARYVENGKVGFINEKLEIVIPAQFDFASYFEEGIAKICNGCRKVYHGEHSQMEGGLWGILDKNGGVTWNKE